MSEHEHKSNLLSNHTSGGFWNSVKLPVIVVVALSIFLLAATYVWAQSYDGRMPPGAHIGDLELAGLEAEEAQLLVQERVDQILTEGISVVMNSQEEQLPLVTLVSTDLIEDAAFSVDEVIDRLATARHPNPLLNILYLFSESVNPTETLIEIELQTEQLTQSLLNLYPDVQTLSVATSYDLTFEGEEWIATVTEGQPGSEFQIEDFFTELESNLQRLNGSEMELVLLEVEPEISVEEAEDQTEQLLTILESAPYTITFTEENDSWDLTATALTTMLVPTETGSINLDQAAFQEWFVVVTDDVNQPAVDARLEITDGRVTDFVESEEGREVNTEEMYELVSDTVLSEKNKPVELVMEIEEPVVKTGDVNDLGITEILGTGTSSYRGSPANRQVNIQNGVDLLDGLLIAPGETFSLIDALSPFTYDNGYLAELVIKGDEITPELGGGLCQIGTTTFRATMNAGLEVTERRNHSLVVNYYNDPGNGNPGTDATIYEPAPDYKFTNDTDHYVLFQAENLTATQDLRFTFWGTSDGRQGSYEPPVVTRWIPVGETQYIETEDLEPGVTQCQGAHIGADAQFTYTVTHPDGEVEETTYTSHYRPLPQICLVGIDPDAVEEEEEMEDDTDAEEETTEDADDSTEEETEETE